MSKLPTSSNPLLDLKVDQLKSICQGFGLPSSGTKTELIARILGHDPACAEKMLQSEPEGKLEAEKDKPVLDSGKVEAEPNQMMMMMFMKMMEKQEEREERRREEDQRRQEVREEKLMRLLTEQSRMSASRSQERLLILVEPAWRDWG